MSDAAQALAQPVADRPEEHVADRVAEAVVHGLEVVEVDEEDGDAAALANGARQRVLEAVLEQGAVREPGQAVVEGQVAELALEPLAVGDVAAGENAARIVSELAPHPLEDDPRALPRGEAALEAARRHSGGRVAERIGVLGVGEVEQLPADEVARQQAEHRQRGVGHVGHGRVGLHDDDELGGVLDELAEPALALAQRALVGVGERAARALERAQKQDAEEGGQGDEDACRGCGPERRRLSTGSGGVERPAQHALETVQARVDPLVAHGERLVEPALGEQAQLVAERLLVDRGCIDELRVGSLAELGQARELGVHRPPARPDLVTQHVRSGAVRGDRLPLEAALLVRKRAKPLERELLTAREVGLLAQLEHADDGTSGEGQDGERSEPTRERPAHGLPHPACATGRTRPEVERLCAFAALGSKTSTSVLEPRSAM